VRPSRSSVPTVRSSSCMAGEMDYLLLPLNNALFLYR
jgi:hypothetical protein